MQMLTNSWQLQNAKNKFSNLVDKAQHNGPQVVTKHGKDAVVVISIDEYKKSIRANPDSLGIYKKISDIYFKLGDKDKAEKFLWKGVTFNTGKKDISGKVANTHGNSGAIRVIFETGMPGQCLGKEVKINWFYT